MVEPVAGIPFSLGVPKGWFRMPEPSDASGGARWVDETVVAVSTARGFEGAEAERLRRSLTAALVRAAAQQRPGRVRLVYLGWPELPVVRAWAALELYAAPGQTPQAHAAALTAAETRAEVALTTLAGGLPAVTLHDFPVAPAVPPRDSVVASSDPVAAPSAAESGRRDPGPRALQHRFVAALFLPGERILQLQISTPDLTAFADLPAVGRAMADSIVLGDGSAVGVGGSGS